VNKLSLKRVDDERMRGRAEVVEPRAVKRSQQTPPPSTGKISLAREIRNSIGGNNIPTCQIPRSKERLFEGAVMEVEGVTEAAIMVDQ
jgi:hypothetical protein